MKKILISIILCGCKTAVSREIKTETRYNQIEINAAMEIKTTKDGWVIKRIIS